MKVLVLGLNPAWQKTLEFSQFQVGQVNRAATVATGPGGKGIHFARAARSIGCQAVVAQFAGGHTGKLICAELEAEGCLHWTVPTQSTTRTCTTLLSGHDHSMTEIVEPGTAVSPDEAQQMQALLREQTAQFRGIALCGTCPPGTPPDLYEDVIARNRDHALILLDAYIDVMPALRAGPQLLKINEQEICSLTGCGTAAAAARQCLSSFPLTAVMVTAGGREAHLFTTEQQWSFKLATVDRVVNPLGAGDTAAAVLLCRLLQRLEAAGMNMTAAVGQPQALPADMLVESWRDALGAATASCLHRAPAEFSTGEAAALARRIVITSSSWQQEWS
jgi:tagatose 6-phosphate kinase